MPSTYSQGFQALIKWLALPFFLLFLFRLLYGYLATDSGIGYEDNRDFFSSVENLRKNYASEKFANNNVQQRAEAASSQKYEKTATVKSKTTGFEKDEADVRT